MASRRRRYRARPKKPQVKRPPANTEITAPAVRLIGAEGQQLGVVPTLEARALAEAAEADLVIVAQKADPPVARIMDLGKYTYEQKKKIAKQKARSKGGEVKGIRISFKISDHDRTMRLHQTDDFLQQGHKVKIEMRLRGREKGRVDMAKRMLSNFVQDVPNGAAVEGTVGTAPNNISAVVARMRTASPPPAAA